MITFNKITMKNRTKYILMAFAALLFSACDPDVAPILTYNGNANCTIAELLTYHEAGALDSFDSVPKGTIISGIVTSSDETGNCYKFLTIQDSTGAIQIKINNTALFHKYPIGQRIFVKCDGLVLGDYRKLHQLGWWDSGAINGSNFGAMTAIASSREGEYIFRDGAPMPEPIPIVITAASQIKPEYYNCLVKIEEAYFSEGGTATFSESSAATSRTLNMTGGGSIEMRTNNYATFASSILPEGIGTVYGILTRYNNTNQLVIRSLNDLQNFTSLQDVFTVDFSQDPFNCGWQQITSAGSNSWQYLSNSTYKGFKINGQAGDCSYLISPEITAVQQMTLTLTHRVPNNLGNSNGMKLYYTSSFNGAINEAEWHEIAIPSYPSGEAEVSLPLPELTSSGSFRLIFKYADNQASSWYIMGINVSGQVRAITK